MKYSNKSFADAEAKKFVSECEASFEKALDEAIAQVCAVKNLKAIGLSGPTCSGKTTTAKKLIGEFMALGREVHVVSIDDFFKDNINKDVSQGDNIDLDSIDALDVEAFEKCVDEIAEGKIAEIPKFDFASGRRVGYTQIQPDPEDLYIFEGIQAVYPEITKLLSHFNSRSVYICVEQGIQVDGKIFRPEEIRLMRRIVRDSNFRGATPDYTMFLWQSVRRNEDKNILPYASGCDVRIDSVMPYEINLLARYLRPLLQTVPQNSEYRDDAEQMLKKLEGIETISPSLIPDGSLYYEFIKK